MLHAQEFQEFYQCTISGSPSLDLSVKSKIVCEKSSYMSTLQTYHIQKFNQHEKESSTNISNSQH
jgi:hypothetical protein